MAPVPPLSISLKLLASSLFVALSVGCVKIGAGPPAGSSGGAAPPSTGGRTGSGGGPGSGGATTGTGGVTATGGSGSGGSGTGGTNSGGTPGSGGAVGSGGTPGTGGAVVGSGGATPVDGGGSDRICQTAQLNWVPKVPNVFVLVDRSGSMFDTNATLPMGAWPPLRDGVLEVIMKLQHDIRFGFGAFTGEQASGKCPDFPTVPIAIDNYATINTAYRGLGDIRPFNNSETPVMLVLPMVRAFLNQAPAGDKYILFVTDGEPDYCDNGNSLCSVDNVIANLQALKSEGIHTFVFGVQSVQATVTPEVLQSFANAGANAAVANPFAGRNIWDECNGYPMWRAAHTAAARPTMMPIGVYTTPGATTMVYRPNPADKTALVNQISAVVAGVKSCIFDLGNVDGKAIKVDLAQLANARVRVMGTEVPRDDTNGWRMNSVTQLELVGSACTNWRMPNVTVIDFQFPCGTIIFE